MNQAHRATKATAYNLHLKIWGERGVLRTKDLTVTVVVPVSQKEVVGSGKLLLILAEGSASVEGSHWQNCPQPGFGQPGP